jgi:hypothetical protein
MVAQHQPRQVALIAACESENTPPTVVVARPENARARGRITEPQATTPARYCPQLVVTWGRE